jgi:hypothetical protein
VAFSCDFAPTADGGVWILDRRHLRLWALDRQLRVVGRNTAPPAAGRTFARWADRESKNDCAPTAPIKSSMAFPLSASGPIALDILPGGGLVLLVRAWQITVHRIDRGETIGASISLDEELHRWLQGRRPPRPGIPRA